MCFLMTKGDQEVLALGEKQYASKFFLSSPTWPIGVTHPATGAISFFPKELVPLGPKEKQKGVKE